MPAENVRLDTQFMPNQNETAAAGGLPRRLIDFTLTISVERLSLSARNFATGARNQAQIGAAIDTVKHRFRMCVGVAVNHDPVMPAARSPVNLCNTVWAGDRVVLRCVVTN